MEIIHSIVTVLITTTLNTMQIIHSIVTVLITHYHLKYPLLKYPPHLQSEQLVTYMYTSYKLERQE